MLTQKEFELWCHQLQLKEETVSLIAQIRNSPPNRRVSSAKGNVSGRYPSRKMGLIVQFESHRNELAAIFEYEYDNDVLEYYDQPFPPLKLKYKSKSGKNLSVLHTPDFFIIRTTSAGWVECKTEKDLIRLSEVQPTRYQFVGKGEWRCFPGEQYAYQLGLSYQLRSDLENNKTYMRNLEFLEDYFRSEGSIVTNNTRQKLFGIVQANPGITLKNLMDEAVGISYDEIYSLIATGELYIDLAKSLLIAPNQVQVSLFSGFIAVNGRDLKTSQQKPVQHQFEEILNEASPDDLIEANRRYKVISAYLQNGMDMLDIPRRTVLFWLANYHKAYAFGSAGQKKETHNFKLFL